MFPDSNPNPLLESGITKRELFAAMMLQGILASGHARGGGSTMTPKQRVMNRVVCAVDYADLLLEQLKK